MKPTKLSWVWFIGASIIALILCFAVLANAQEAEQPVAPPSEEVAPPEQEQPSKEVEAENVESSSTRPLTDLEIEALRKFMHTIASGEVEEEQSSAAEPLASESDASADADPKDVRDVENGFTPEERQYIHDKVNEAKRIVLQIQARLPILTEEDREFCGEKGKEAQDIIEEMANFLEKREVVQSVVNTTSSETVEVADAQEPSEQDQPSAPEWAKRTIEPKKPLVVHLNGLMRFILAPASDVEEQSLQQAETAVQSLYLLRDITRDEHAFFRGQSSFWWSVHNPHQKSGVQSIVEWRASLEETATNIEQTILEDAANLQSYMTDPASILVVQLTSEDDLAIPSSPDMSNHASKTNRFFVDACIAFSDRLQGIQKQRRIYREQFFIAFLRVLSARCDALEKRVGEQHPQSQQEPVETTAPASFSPSEENAVEEEAPK